LKADVLIVGSGIAGLTAGLELRSRGFEGTIAIVGDEVHAPYDRPPLSKLYLTSPGSAEIDLRFLDGSTCEFVLGDRAAALETARRYIRLASGRKIEYQKLILATGSSARKPPDEQVNVPSLVLRTKADADKLRGYLRAGSNLTIIGGGIIGLEVAATARALGVGVEVVELSSRLLGRAAAPELAAFLQQTHEAKGVRFRFGVTSSVENGRLLFSDGSTLKSDVVLWSIGAVPNDELASAAGIECDQGILVDEAGRTSASGIYAIGDVARFRDSMRRHETWTSAREQAATVAQAILDPQHLPGMTIPYYWSDQYEHKIHVLGEPNGDENIVQLGTAATGPRVIYHIIGKKLRGVSLIDSASLLTPARRALLRQIDYTVEQIMQPGFSLRSSR